MRRDWALLRNLLLDIEGNKMRTGDHGAAPHVVDYHMHLLRDAGWLQADSYITPEGQVFVDLIRDEDAWNRLFALAEERGVGLTTDLLTELLPKLKSTS